MVVVAAQAAFDKPTWKPVILIVVASVVFSVWKEGWPGFSLLVGGFFFAYFYRRDQIQRLLWDLNQAKYAMAMAREDGEEDIRFRPERFSQCEELTGERNDSLDRISAWHLRAVSRQSENTNC